MRQLPTLREWLAEAPFTLALSSGFFGFFAHAGLVCALEEAGLFPLGASGSSAGALIASLWASGRSAMEIRSILFTLKREDFWDPAPGLGLLRGAKFRRLLGQHMQAHSFESLRFRLAVSACDILAWRTRVFASGPLIEAVHASCAFPILFQPVFIGGRPYADGGILDRPGIAGLAHLGHNTRVLIHHLGTRSPWRRPQSPTLRPPTLPGAVTVVVRGLPRVGPHRLAVGPDAFVRTYEAVRRVLTMQVETQGNGTVMEVPALAP